MNSPRRRPSPARQTLLVRGAILAIVAILLGAGVAILVTIRPTDDSIYPKCSFHRLTGWHCPGCGTARSLHSLFNGRIEQSLAYNPFTMILFPLIAISLIQSLWHWMWGTVPRGQSLFTTRILAVLVALLFVFGVLRNLPYYPLTLLAPHELSRTDDPAPVEPSP